MKKKLVALFLAVAMVGTLFVGCTQSNTSQATSTLSSASSQTQSTEPVVLKFAAPQAYVESSNWQELWKLVETETNGRIKIEPLIIPGDSTENTQKVMINLMAGDEMDIMYMLPNIAAKFQAANLIKSLNPIIEKTGYDVEKIYGNNLQKFNDEILFLPSLKDVHVLVYNKDIFDAAGVPYPDGKNFTWDDYTETAKKLTDANKGIFGSWMIGAWDVYSTFQPKMKKVPAYKEDGTSNFDDPAWSEGFKYYYDLSNVYHVQPDHVSYKSQKMTYDQFMNGKYGMWAIGTWALAGFGDTEKYPRDYKVGITRLPQINTGESKTLGITAGYAVLSTTKHYEEAFEAVKIMAENQYKLGYGIIPARVDLDSTAMEDTFNTMLESFKNDEITKEELAFAMTDPELEICDEKVVGKGAARIELLVGEVVDLYCSDQMTLEEAMAYFKSEADKAIADDK